MEQLMKKLALLGLLNVAMMASESGWYVGGDVGRTKEKDETSTGNHYSNTSTAYSAKIGYYFDNNVRGYAFYQHINRGDFAKPTNAYGGGCDYLFGDNAFKPFLGAIVGYSVYKNGNYKQDGLAYGGQVGINYGLNEHFSVDAGYRYLFSDATYKSGNYKEEITSFQSFFAGVNYKF
jgi:opacity protein-like surface antigen